MQFKCIKIDLSFAYFICSTTVIISLIILYIVFNSHFNYQTF